MGLFTPDTAGRTGPPAFSMALESIKGFAAREAAMQRFARGRSKLAEQFSVLAAAAGTGKPFSGKQTPPPGGARRGRDPIVQQLAPPLRAQPIRRPGRGQHRPNPEFGESRTSQSPLDFPRDHCHRRAPRVGGGDRDLHHRSCESNIAQDSQVFDRQDGNLRILHRRDGSPGARKKDGVIYHTAPGYRRGRTCISARRCPRCSVCRPVRPPLCIQRSSG